MSKKKIHTLESISKYVKESGMPMGAIPEYPKDFPSYSDKSYYKLGMGYMGSDSTASAPFPTTGDRTIPLTTMAPPPSIPRPPSISDQYLIQLMRIADSLEKLADRFV